MKNSNTWQPLEMDTERELVSHRDPGEEFQFYRAVAEGRVSDVQQNCISGAFENPEGVGRLSDNPLTNLRYHFVVTAALITRFCMEGGMALEEAFGLSDDYIQKMDRCTSLAEIVLLHDQMALDYAGRMLSLKKRAASSKQVAEAIDYIYVHITERFTVDDLAKAICISPTYLSRIFKQETGVSVSEYIRQRKIDMAKNLLRFSDHNLVEIANMLSYSSQSHFIQHFHAQTGMTPKVYRDRYYMNNWDVKRTSEEAPAEGGEKPVT